MFGSKMNIPACFEYNKKSSQKHYSSEPQGVFDVAAFVANKPRYWVSYLPSSVTAKKSLVLSDWTMKGWSYKKEIQVIVVLRQLIDQGFTVYLATPDEIMRLEYASLTEVDWREDGLGNPMSDQSVINATMQQHNLAVDEVQLIDNYWLNYLLSGQDVPGPQVLKVSELPELGPAEMQRISEEFNGNPPKFKQIVQDSFSSVDNKKVLQLSNFSEYVTTDIKKLVLYGATDLSRVSVNASSLEQLCMTAMSRRSIQQWLKEAMQLKKT